MNDKHTEAQINAYFTGKMDASQQKEFTTELDHNQELQKAVFIYAMQQEKKYTPESERIRSTIVEIRNKMGSLPEVKLRWWDYIRFLILEWPVPQLKWLGILTILGIIIIGLWANTRLQSVDDLIQLYAPKAYCPGVAGEGKDIDDKIYKRSSDFYCQYKTGGLDSLQAVVASCTNFCIANYYLAHEQLSNKKYQEAENGFATFLNQQDKLSRFDFKPNIGELEFNLYLSQLGQKNKRKQALGNLEDLLADTTFPSYIRADIRELLDELRHPLRLLLVDLD